MNWSSCHQEKPGGNGTLSRFRARLLAPAGAKRSHVPVYPLEVQQPLGQLPMPARFPVSPKKVPLTARQALPYD